MSEPDDNLDRITTFVDPTDGTKRSVPWQLCSMAMRTATGWIIINGARKVWRSAGWSIRQADWDHAYHWSGGTRLQKRLAILKAEDPSVRLITASQAKMLEYIAAYWAEIFPPVVVDAPAPEQLTPPPEPPQVTIKISCDTSAATDIITITEQHLDRACRRLSLVQRIHECQTRERDLRLQADECHKEIIEASAELTALGGL